MISEDDAAATQGWTFDFMLPPLKGSPEAVGASGDRAAASATAEPNKVGAVGELSETASVATTTRTAATVHTQGTSNSNYLATTGGADGVRSESGASTNSFPLDAVSDVGTHVKLHDKPPPQYVDTKAPPPAYTPPPSHPPAYSTPPPQHQSYGAPQPPRQGNTRVPPWQQPLPPGQLPAHVQLNDGSAPQATPPVPPSQTMPQLAHHQAQLPPPPPNYTNAPTNSGHQYTTPRNYAPQHQHHQQYNPHHQQHPQYQPPQQHSHQQGPPPPQAQPLPPPYAGGYTGPGSVPGTLPPAVTSGSMLVQPRAAVVRGADPRAAQLRREQEQQLQQQLPPVKSMTEAELRERTRQALEELDRGFEVEGEYVWVNCAVRRPCDGALPLGRK